MFKNIIAAITGFFKKEIPEVETGFTEAVKLFNVLKTFAGSAAGQTVEAIVAALLPQYAPTILADLSIFFTDFGLVVAEVGKPISEIVADGLNAIAKLTGNSQVIAYSNVSAIIGNAASAGQATIQQAIVATPVVYNPSVLSDTTPAAQSPSDQSATNEAAAEGATADPNA